MKLARNSAQRRGRLSRLNPLEATFHGSVVAHLEVSATFDRIMKVEHPRSNFYVVFPTQLHLVNVF